MKITLSVEITEKELAQALLPNGGKITEVSVEATPTRRRRTSPTTQSESAAKKTTKTQQKKKTVSKTKTTS